MNGRASPDRNGWGAVTGATVRDLVTVKSSPLRPGGARPSAERLNLLA